MDEQRFAHNWAGHVRWSAARTHSPTTLAEVQRIVAASDAVGVIGARHCFTDIADTDGDLLWLGALEGGVEMDSAARTARVPAGATYTEIAPAIHAAGLALPNLASLGHVTVAGAAMTATHGSGVGLGNLACAVSALEFVAADGSLVALNRATNPDSFPGAVVSLGALGVVTTMTLDLVPTFDLTQSVYVALPWDAVYEQFDALTGCGYSVSLFPTWRSDHCERLWVKRVVDATLDARDAHDAAIPTTLFGSVHVPAAELAHTNPARDRTALDAPGPWHERLPHFVLHDAVATGDETQTEYLVDRAVALDAMRAVASLRPKLAPVLFISEIRTVAADDLWLSMAYGRDSVAIHFTWENDPAGVEALLPELEAALAPFDARPHWGKLFAMPAAVLAARYPHMDDFRALCARYDPTGKFRNRYLRRHVFGG